MKSVCLYFQVHQPFRLRTYRFFDIGKNHDYFDDYANRFIMQQVAEKCYLPANEVLLGLIKTFGKEFKASFSISGTALDQFEMYAPKVLESFQNLAKTGSIEFLTETHSHSLASLKNKKEFSEQVSLHAKRIKKLFGQTPLVFRNTELIYSNEIGDMVYDMGYKTMITEGAKHVLGWKSPNYLYYSASNSKLKLLLKNFQLSDDIAFRFSERRWNEWPLTAEKFVGWLGATQPKEEVINLFMDYETFGEHQWAETGIFDFLKAFPAQLLKKTNISFSTPSECAARLQPVAPLNAPYPISWADEERDLTAWLGNEMQDEAYRKLYLIEDKVRQLNDAELLSAWRKLQTSDHFYYICTKWFSDGTVHRYFNPYASPYDAFINYMNVLSDFTIRVETKWTELSLSEKTGRKKKAAAKKA
jgi:alpha-amylase